MNVFETLPEFLQTALKRMLIDTPTPIQQRALPPALAGQDVLGTAQTGTGKTLAFLLPLVVRLTQSPAENALVLSPTRELAQQILTELEKLTDALPAALIIGGDNIHKQYAALRRKPRVLIATPGRLIDHLTRKSVELSRTHFLVLDETDRMLDMGFIDDMRRIIAALPGPRQTLLFSATLPDEIKQLSHEFLTRPVRVQIGEVTSAACGVLQEIVYVSVREKLPQLIHELNTRAGSILVFVKTKHGAERLAKELKRYGQKVSALHGELRQNRRRQVMEFFRNGTLRVLVATDLAARGLDVPQIAHVINYDLPQCPQDYIHRVGRTGRAGSVGSALSFISDDGAKWKEICRVTQFASAVKTIQKTSDPLPAPKFVAHEEGEIHAQRRKKSGAARPVSKYTQRAKELLQSGAVPLPQQPKIAMRALKKPKTFKKATAAARVLEQEQTQPATSFRTVKVGLSKKALQKLEQTKKSTPPRNGKANFKKFFKQKKKR